MKKLSLILLLALILCLVVGFQDKAAMAELEEQDAASNLPGFIFSASAPNSDETIRILVHYDMEGLSGQDDWRTAFYQYPEQYKRGRELLTADVNAVIEGLFHGGADEVYVRDGHGSGSPGPDIIIEQMDSRAEFFYRRKALRKKPIPELGSFDAIAVVGMHSKTGGGGFMAHTSSLGMDYILNERSVNETELLMLVMARSDIPVIFASGDDKLKEQLQPYPWIEYVTVKYATSTSTAELRPLMEVHNEIRMAAARAVKNIPNAKVVKPETPIKAGLRAEPPASLSVLDGVPGINYHDETVTFEAKTHREAMRYIRVLASVARTEYHHYLMQTVSNQDNSKEILEEYWNNLFISWLDIQSNQKKPLEK
jgi:D-amino peptidase